VSLVCTSLPFTAGLFYTDKDPLSVFCILPPFFTFSVLFVLIHFFPRWRTVPLSPPKVFRAFLFAIHSPFFSVPIDCSRGFLSASTPFVPPLPPRTRPFIAPQDSGILVYSLFPLSFFLEIRPIPHALIYLRIFFFAVPSPFFFLTQQLLEYTSVARWQNSPFSQPQSCGHVAPICPQLGTLAFPPFTKCIQQPTPETFTVFLLPLRANNCSLRAEPFKVLPFLQFSCASPKGSQHHQARYHTRVWVIPPLISTRSTSLFLEAIGQWAHSISAVRFFFPTRN